MKDKAYHTTPFNFHRRMVRASILETRRKNSIHSLTEVDIEFPRHILSKHARQTGEKLSFTAYVVHCLAKVVNEEFPQFNSFRKGRRIVILHDVTISVLIERDLKGERVPEPVGITAAQEKSFRQIHNEIRKAQANQNKRLGSLAGMSWIKLIPGFLLRTFVRLADRNLKLAKKYGKIGVTAVGMFGEGPAWFVPHGSPTLLVTVGSIHKKVVESNGEMQSREHLSLTVSYDHDLIDGAPAARFLKAFSHKISSGKLINDLITDDEIMA